MKKVLFYAGLLVFAASCTEDELASFSAQEQTKGITFVEEAGPSTRMQWDDAGTSYVPFWYAEQDRIGIYGLNVKKGFSASSDVTGDGFDDLTSSIASVTYKATQSKKNGAFTSVADADMLLFDGDKEARFVAVYPSTIKAEHKAGKIVLSSLPDLAAQTQTTAKGNNSAIVMYDLTQASKVNAYDAVGEKVKLQFQRPLSALVFQTKNVDDYSTIFGALSTIKVKTTGYDKDAQDGALDAAKGDILASALTYDESKATIEVDTLSKVATFNAGTTPSEGSEVTLTLDMPWKDGDLAIAAVKNVDRSAFREKNVKEGINVVFNFVNIDLASKTTDVSIDFNGFVEFPSLNIAEYDYLVTKGEAGKTRTLIVNKGNFADIFSGNNVKWADSESADNSKANEVPVNEFQKVIINENVVLTDAEFAQLNTFTGVKELTIKGNTEIKENALDALDALEMIDMPKVTTIGKSAFSASAPMKTVLLPSYKFEELSINPQILKTSTLETLDMSGVDVMNAGFPAKGLSLADYASLKKVTVKDGVLVGANAFKGCTALEAVMGKVELVGTAAFKGCEALTEINITNAVIPANAFDGAAKLEKILKDDAQVAPTEVGSQAFKGCAALEVMNLRNATKIGEEAFMDCAAFVGTEKAENDKNVLYVGAETIPARAFAGCVALEYVYFINANGFGDGILGSTDTNDDTQAYSLKEVKFGTSLLKANVANATATTFGNAAKAAKVKLFVNPDQDVTMLNDATLVIKKDVEITFASITKEAKY